ncbi:unnamed protein product [Amaranthus hypochondriacus]
MNCSPPLFRPTVLLHCCGQLFLILSPSVLSSSSSNQELFSLKSVRTKSVSKPAKFVPGRQKLFPAGVSVHSLTVQLCSKIFNK